MKTIDALKGREKLSPEQWEIVIKARNGINALIESKEPPDGTLRDGEPQLDSKSFSHLLSELKKLNQSIGGRIK